MTTDQQRQDELQPLLSAMFDGQMMAAEQMRLSDLLRDAPEAQQTYLDFCWTHALLRRELGAYGEVASLGLDGRRGTLAGWEGSGGRGQGSGVRGQESETDVGSAVELPNELEPANQQSTISNQQSFIAPIVLDLSSAVHSPPFTLHSPVGSFLFSYTVGALLLGIGLLMGWTWRISQDCQPRVAQSSTSPPPEVAGVKVPLVGRVSGTVDCRWTDAKTKVSERDAVPLGHTYDLVSGLLEITYDTGAKVILQGPCRYEVESRAGGYLLLGKLTARVGKSGEGRGARYERPTVQGSEAWGERTANLALSHKERKPTTSLAPHPSATNGLEVNARKDRETRRQGDREKGNGAVSPPLLVSLSPRLPIFTVRTPAAVVTDLGTEFGVLVEKTGATRSHVFQGRIEVSPAGGYASDSRPVQLGVNESVLIEVGQKTAVVVSAQSGQSMTFVRQMPNRTSSGPLRTGRASAATSAYRLTDLGTLGGAASRAYDINAAGQVVGSSDLTSGVAHAFLYDDGRMKDLDPAGADASYAFRVNNSGKIVGAANSSDQQLRAFLYSGGKMTYLQRAGTLSSTASGINSAGIVAGVVTDSNGVAHAFRSDGGQLTASLVMQARSWVADINDHDQAVGYLSKAQGVMHAFIDDGKAVKELPDLDGGNSYATRINGLGQVVGYCDVPGGNAHAVLWDAAGIHDLGTLGGPSSRAEGINNGGQVVGGALDARGAPHAFLYAAGVMSDLNAMIPPDSGWTLQIAMAINNSGQIVGNGMAPDGNTPALLLTPSVARASRSSEKASAPQAQEPPRKEGLPMK